MIVLHSADSHEDVVINPRFVLAVWSRRGPLTPGGVSRVQANDTANVGGNAGESVITICTVGALNFEVLETVRDVQALLSTDQKLSSGEIAHSQTEIDGTGAVHYSGPSPPGLFNELERLINQEPSPD